MPVADGQFGRAGKHHKHPVPRSYGRDGKGRMRGNTRVRIRQQGNARIRLSVRIPVRRVHNDGHGVGHSGGLQRGNGGHSGGRGHNGRLSRGRRADEGRGILRRHLQPHVAFRLDGHLLIPHDGRRVVKAAAGEGHRRGVAQGRAAGRHDGQGFLWPGYAQPVDLSPGQIHGGVGPLAGHEQLPQGLVPLGVKYGGLHHAHHPRPRQPAVRRVLEDGLRRPAQAAYAPRRAQGPQHPPRQIAVDGPRCLRRLQQPCPKAGNLPGEHGNGDDRHG